ncbi:DUF551 domain-containing protein [Salmonella enterica]|uniref:DUF551 domain-containing protein n=1 Tax=Salmonella enterica TaxID=28901 RepID=UPI0009ADFA92|nr:DUF551 domain-containing protein [Salmonella enterica]
MTTITREQQKQILIDTANHVISRDNTSPYSENLRELARIALAALEAEPIGAFHIADQQVGGTSDYIKDGEWPIDNGVIDVYAAPPVQETGVYKDMLNIISLLENNEWAEHCTSTVLGSLLESEITRLVGKEQPVPVVPDEKWVNPDINYAEENGFAEGWNACRAAMLHGAEPVSQTYKLNELSGNSPVSPGGWISCSERMPDSKTVVLVAREFGRKGDWRMKWATYIPWHPDTNDGWLIPGASWKPSHWMPLPEPPQQ